MLKYKIPQIVTLTRYNANTCAFLSIKWSINEKIRGLYYYAPTLGQFRLLFHFKLNKAN